MSDAKMDDMPQMPETRGFLEIFQDMLKLDLIGEEWGETLSPAVIAGIAVTCLSAVGAGAYAAWYNWTNEEDGILRRIAAYFSHEDSIWERMFDCFHHEESFMDKVKKTFGYKED